MKQRLLVTISAIFVSAMLAVSPSLACISCNYTPEVVNTPVKKGAGATNKKARAAKARKAPVSRKRIAKPKPAPQQPNKEETSTAAALEDKKESTETGLSTAALGNRDDGAEPQSHIGCKKFSATAGTTITVPCE